MVHREKSVLLVIDIQVDFLPGGALGVADADALIAPIDVLLQRDRFARVIATQDWHPPGHISFASSHEGHEAFDTVSLYGHDQLLWPDHCVQESPGAQLHPSLHWARADTIIRKGTDPTVDSYSAFRNNWNADNLRPPTGLSGLIGDCELTDVYICGLARDYCVKWSAEDAADAGFNTFVIWDLTRPVDPSSNSVIGTALRARSIDIIESEALS